MKLVRFFIAFLLISCSCTISFAQKTNDGSGSARAALQSFFSQSSFSQDADNDRQHEPQNVPHAVRVALLLPWGSATTSRMTEYYEGFLLAMKDLKKAGISIDLQVYNIGTETNLLPSIFNKASMSKVDLVIGGLSDEQTQSIAAFCSQRNIPYVIPFTSQNASLLNYPNAYQVNMPQTVTYPIVAEAFCKKYINANVILCRKQPNKGNKVDFHVVLERELDAKFVTHTTADADNLFENLQLVLVPDRLNVIVPDDDSEQMLAIMANPLKTTAELHPEFQMSLFGYPSWQSYTSNLLYRHNASFYSIYYADMASPKVKTFQTTFQNWYSHNLIASFPKYGMLGYDTAMYFIKLINQYGIAIGSNINNLKYSGVQTNFNFETVTERSGAINTNLFFVEYKPNKSVFVTSVR
ncbi:hypothetical protein SAMD00024442_11_60 [Candidatus Symbiothrix dinenymphae]|nr:hypothetical protein SAMD00024442_11_60 [Candidatus Symbiothrix dinenymphae]